MKLCKLHSNSSKQQQQSQMVSRTHRFRLQYQQELEKMKLQSITGSCYNISGTLETAVSAGAPRELRNKQQQQ